MKKYLIFSIFLFLFLSIFIASANGSNVIVVEVTDTIDQGTVEILKESIKLA